MNVQITDWFDLQKIVDSGQCFRAAPLAGGVYRFLTGDQVLYIRKRSDEEYEVSCDRDTWERVWRPYFDLDRDYRAIQKAIPPEDSFLARAARSGAGIRILRQDPWEMLITFIISQRKSIPAIRAVVEQLCEQYGTELPASAGRLYTFPTAAQLKDVCAEDFLACKAGYRAPYLCDAVQRVYTGRLDLNAIAALPDEKLIAALEEVKGVGVKVANCVALFAYGRTACAPVDTWIQKVIRQQYHGVDPFARYGEAAGIMQQYFFYHAQTHKGETA